MRVVAKPMGFEEAKAKLETYRVSMRKRMLRKAVRAGSAEIRKTMKAYAPVGVTGALKKSLTNIVAKSKPNSDKILGVIGPRRKFTKDGAKPAKYAHLVEGGTAPHRIMPKLGKPLLRLVVNGRVRYVTSVNHGGAKPRRFISNTAATSANAARMRFESKLRFEVVNQALKKRAETFDDGN